MKRCSRCKRELPLENFTKNVTKPMGLDIMCRECKSKRRRQYYQKYREQELEGVREYQSMHKEEISEQRKKHYQDNADRLRKLSNDYYHQNKRERNIKHAAYCKNRYHRDILYRLRVLASKSVGYYLRMNGGSKKGRSCLRFFPFTIEQLKEHLEQRFDSWMNWENYGIYSQLEKRWQIDHIVPQTFYRYTSMDSDEFRKCWSLENLRPLEVIENIRKGGCL